MEKKGKTLSRTDLLLERVRSGGSNMTTREQVELAARLALPAILAQISSIVMEYIDASMVGQLGAISSASIGLIATTTWLFWGLGSAAATGFSVQVAHKIGASDAPGARRILRQSLVVCLSLGLLLMLIGISISGRLPYWLGGNEEIAIGATEYFLIFAFTMPVFLMTFLMSSMLRCSGNVKVPSLLNVSMCVLDVLFNFLLIFPTRDIHLFGTTVTMPGAGLGIMGAALGTLFAEIITASLLFYFLCFRSIHLRIFGRRIWEQTTWLHFRPTMMVLRKAVKIGMPIGCERVIMCGAQITTTMIVAPLGMFAIAANSFGVNAESLCYMPGYGIADAATTLVGQSVGAKREELARRFASITVIMGISVMALMGLVMYIAAPAMMSFMSPVPEIVGLGVEALRIEAFAEPMFAASIVCYGVFVGAGDTLIPSSMNLGAIWAVRITLAFILAPVMGLNGVWLAMCIELNLRGVMFLLRLHSRLWIPKDLRPKTITQ
ncbi:MAG: MATE family efflux transporter [Bacteroidaceae bacterium]|nr:MATE family efflux transporter [Bacteroidaceae bacterium]